MKIVICMDSFKGSIDSWEAGQAAARGLQAVLSEAEITVIPVADGGEGTARAMLHSQPGEWIPQTVMGPLPDMQVEAGYAWFPETQTALVEMASASGLTLLSPAQQNPLKTTTFGTGELIKAAAEKGAEHILLAVGGSATVDGGVGAAMALGWEFLDAEGNSIGLGGGRLNALDKISRSGCIPMPAIEVLCDVSNPLCGDNGAAKVYAPQKGADAAMVEQLAQGLQHLADKVQEDLGKDIADLPGGGASGGLSAGAAAFMDASLTSGIERIMEVSGMSQAMINADWVITGEGKFDHQSVQGKVISGITRLAREHDCRVAVLAGTVELDAGQYEPLGIRIARATKPEDLSLTEAMKRGGELIESAARKLAEEITG